MRRWLMLKVFAWMTAKFAEGDCDLVLKLMDADASTTMASVGRAAGPSTKARTGRKRSSSKLVMPSTRSVTRVMRRERVRAACTPR